MSIIIYTSVLNPHILKSVDWDRFIRFLFYSESEMVKADKQGLINITHEHFPETTYFFK